MFVTPEVKVLESTYKNTLQAVHTLQIIKTRKCYCTIGNVKYAFIYRSIYNYLNKILIR